MMIKQLKKYLKIRKYIVVLINNEYSAVLRSTYEAAAAVGAATVAAPLVGSGL